MFPIFSHEPNVVRGPRGEWVMFLSQHIPDTPRVECNCSDGNTPEDHPGHVCTDLATPDTNPTWMTWRYVNVIVLQTQLSELQCTTCTHRRVSRDNR